MSSNISKSSLYKVLTATTAVSRSSLIAIMHNAVEVSRVAKYLILNNQDAPRRTMVNVSYVMPMQEDVEWRVLGMFPYDPILSGVSIQFREMEWSETAGGPSLFTDPELFDSSSELGGAYLKAHATDEDPATLFALGGFKNYWLSYVLPATATVGAIRFLPDTFPAQTPQDMVLQSKVLGEWTTIGDFFFNPTTPTDNVWNEAVLTPYEPPPISVAAPHKYWRIVVAGVGQNNRYFILQQLQLLDSVGADMALLGGKTITYTEQQGGPWLASNIFEANSAQWASNGNLYRHFIGIEFATAHAIASYKLTAGPASTAPTAWRIECSDNGTDWKIADEQYLQTWTANEIKEFTF